MSAARLRFASLGSGSKGNGTLVEAGGTRVLIDCGFALRDAESRLERLGIEPASIDAILVTHEHGDHLGGVGRFARRHATAVHLTAGTAQAWNDGVDGFRRINPHEAFRIGALEVQPYPVPHDAREPCQFVLAHGGRRLGILSDAGHVTPHMRAVLDGCDGLMIEFNHDEDRLAQGPYPYSLKQRVGGPFGHLNNRQSAELLRTLDLGRVQQLVLTHLSETNNTPEAALAAARAALPADGLRVVCADQGDGLAWRELV